jgi:hypothetical protein
MTNIAIENAIFVVDLPIKDGDLLQLLVVYQGIPRSITPFPDLGILLGQVARNRGAADFPGAKHPTKWG